MNLKTELEKNFLKLCSVSRGAQYTLRYSLIFDHDFVCCYINLYRPIIRISSQLMTTTPRSFLRCIYVKCKNWINNKKKQWFMLFFFTSAPCFGVHSTSLPHCPHFQMEFPLHVDPSLSFLT